MYQVNIPILESFKSFLLSLSVVEPYFILCISKIDILKTSEITLRVISDGNNLFSLIILSNILFKSMFVYLLKYSLINFCFEIGLILILLNHSFNKEGSSNNSK